MQARVFFLYFHKSRPNEKLNKGNKFCYNQIQILSALHLTPTYNIFHLIIHRLYNQNIQISSSIAKQRHFGNKPIHCIDFFLTENTFAFSAIVIQIHV